MVPLFRVHAKPREGVEAEALLPSRKDHLGHLHKLASAGKLFGAGQLGADHGMIILICENEAEARAIVERDPYSVAGLRDHEILPWRLNISSIVDIETRAKLNGDDPSNPRYQPPPE